ncbi:hypothetical protein [Hufsiella ginkgonis]|uniref:Uncharacterized protein n=1 Tax=Hufsiella ginkgonis TaxID=2695274 RepID=A0A7K1XXW9_9SPHI|nr:hypothetical protein [Hufsiella ginkgonis]MXV15677.1 hypothetical protein [Hufsiella ginkgonis]
MDYTTQLTWLFTLAIPIACVAWTVTHEQIFYEPREYCKQCSEKGRTLFIRKFFYVFTCEYCFSFYVTAFFIALTDYQLLLTGWRGYLIAEFALMWIANIYMSLFLFLRTGIKKENVESKVLEEEMKTK